MRQKAWTVLGCLLSAIPSLAGDWPQFLGPQRNGQALGEVVVDSIQPKGRPILWRRPVGEGYSGPAVAENRLVLFHGEKGEEVCELLDTANGRTLWRSAYACDYAGGYGTGPGPRATPVIADGRVFTFGATGVLQGLDLATGKVLWKRDFSREFQLPEGFFGVGTSPALDGNRLLLTVGAKKASLVAIDQATGKTIWSVSDDEASYASPVVATLGGEPKGLFFARTGLHVVELTSGREEAFFRWRARMNASVNAATPIATTKGIFLTAEYGTGATLLTWSKGNLDPVWKSNDAMSCHFNTPIELDGHLVGIDGRQEGGARLRCVQIETGEPVWTEEGFGCAVLIRAGKTILAVREEGDLVLFDANPSSYRERGRQRLGTSPTRAHPALSNGVLYVRTPAELLAIDLRP